MIAKVIPPTRNVVVLGCAYAGGRAADLLARTLPTGYRVVVIDRQSHFNHLYLHPRVSIVPGHAEKVFIPFTSVIPKPNENNPSTLSRHVLVHASVVSITEDYVEVDRDLLEHERDLDGDEDEVSKLAHELETAKLDGQTGATRRLSWDYLIYALGCTLPPPLQSPHIVKKDGVAFLSSQCKLISKATKIVVAGGGALGVQYATDIADLYNNPEHEEHLAPHAVDGQRPPKKEITIIQSRDRFLPLYKQELHDEVCSRMEKLGVRTVLGERVALPPLEEDEPGKMKALRLKNGTEIKYDLLLRCTGQKPNSEPFRRFLPKAVNEWGFIKVTPTLQVDVSGVPGYEKLSKKLRRNMFSVGDVADAGVVKAGHTGWNQAEAAVQNIMCCVETDTANAALPAGEERAVPKLVDYVKTPPQIKLTLGLNHSCTEALPAPEAKETVITKASDGPVEGHWKGIWEFRGIPTDDLSI
ncbi:hypothetical protein JCM8097_008218 [Rhodosporidiobolus ruineniae]